MIKRDLSIGGNNPHDMKNAEGYFRPLFIDLWETRKKKDVCYKSYTLSHSRLW